MESLERLVPITAMVLVLWCVGILPKSVNAENATVCTQTSTCSCEFPNGVIDLFPIARHDNQSTFKDIPQSNSNKNFYSWNPCYSFNEPQTASSQDCKNVAACLKVNLSTGIAYHSWGTQESAEFKKVNGKMVIAYKYSGSLVNRISTIYLECDESMTPGTFTIPTGLSSTKNINMYYNGLYACIRSESGLSPGSVILIILLVVVCMYLILGIIFQVFYRKESGRKAIPNSDMWFALGGLTKDGFLFVISPCTGSAGKKYDNI